MSRATPKMRGFAARVIAGDIGAQSAGEKSPQPFLVIEKMRPQLSTLMGNAGFHGLISRALALSGEESAWLRSIRVNANGSLEIPDAITRQAEQTEIAEGEIVLLSQLLGLLMAFLGENLTLRLVRDVWPNLPADDLDPGNEGKNEKAK